MRTKTINAIGAIVKAEPRTLELGAVTQAVGWVRRESEGRAPLSLTLPLETTLETWDLV